MKPDWDKAPEWAKWVAQDLCDGKWWWFQNEPYLCEEDGEYFSKGKYARVESFTATDKCSKEPRP